MKTLQVELPDEMAREVENVVEVVRASLGEFISRRRFELMKQQRSGSVASHRQQHNHAASQHFPSGWLGHWLEGQAIRRFIQPGGKDAMHTTWRDFSDVA